MRPSLPCSDKWMLRVVMACDGTAVERPSSRHFRMTWVLLVRNQPRGLTFQTVIARCRTLQDHCKNPGRGLGNAHCSPSFIIFPLWSNILRIFTFLCLKAVSYRELLCVQKPCELLHLHAKQNECVFVTTLNHIATSIKSCMQIAIFSVPQISHICFPRKIINSV